MDLYQLIPRVYILPQIILVIWLGKEFYIKRK